MTNTIDGLQREIVDDLKIELSDDIEETESTEESEEPGYNENVLNIKVKNAIREVRRVRNYPKKYTEEDIVSDLENNYYDVIHDIALLEYNKIGAEGQSDHSEDDVKRTWVSKDDLLASVHAFVTVL